VEVPKVKRVLIVVQNLPVPFDRRVWLECQALVSAGYQAAVVCPKGSRDPAYEVIDTMGSYTYQPYAPGGSKPRFIAEYAYSFLATARLVLKARRRGPFAVMQAYNPPDISSGDCFEELVAPRDELKLNGHVEFTGRAPDDLVKKIMSTADVGTGRTEAGARG
jgi:hypothetical protein